MRRAPFPAGLACGLAMWASASAQSLQFPVPATAEAERVEALASHDMPVGPWREAGIETLAAEGRLSQTAWHLRAGDHSTLDLLAALRDQLASDGYEVLFSCHTRSCGGFDFRFAIEVLPEPGMHVDLGDFRFLSARRGDGPAAEFLSLLISRSAGTGFVQITHVAPPDAVPAAVLSTRSPFAADPIADAPAAGRPGGAHRETAGDFPATLEAGGAVTLDDLNFATGAATLGPGPFGSLDALAAYLRAHPDRSVTLVGHSDAEGSLSANIALSKRRASAVMETLMRDHGIDRAQVAAEGVGFLAPRASNLTDEGRLRNRRVDAVLTATE